MQNVGTIRPAHFVAGVSHGFPFGDDSLDVGGAHEIVHGGEEPQRRHDGRLVVKRARRGHVMTHRERVRAIQIRVKDRLHERLQDAAFGEQRQRESVGNPGEVDGTVDDLSHDAILESFAAVFLPATRIAVTSRRTCNRRR